LLFLFAARDILTQRFGSAFQCMCLCPKVLEVEHLILSSSNFGFTAPSGRALQVSTIFDFGFLLPPFLLGSCKVQREFPSKVTVLLAIKAGCKRRRKGSLNERQEQKKNHTCIKSTWSGFYFCRGKAFAVMSQPYSAIRLPG
jgi:hypothetical protein